MSFKITQYRAPIKIDFLNQTNLSGSYIEFDYPTTFNTDVGNVNSTTFSVQQGSSYYLEASVSATNLGADGLIRWQFYSQTDAALIGSQAEMNFVGGLGEVARVGRRVASALVLDSDISTSKDIRVQVFYSGTNWKWTEYKTLAHIGYPTIRIIQLPS